MKFNVKFDELKSTVYEQYLQDKVEDYQRGIQQDVALWAMLNFVNVMLCYVTGHTPFVWWVMLLGYGSLLTYHFGKSIYENYDKIAKVRKIKKRYEVTGWKIDVDTAEVWRGR